MDVKRRSEFLVDRYQLNTEIVKFGGKVVRPDPINMPTPVGQKEVSICRTGVTLAPDPKMPDPPSQRGNG